MIKNDDGDKAVEMLLRDTEQEIIKIYDEASKGCYAKLQRHLKAFQRKDAEKRKLVASGELSQADYNAWKHGQIMTGQRWQDMVAILAEDMTNADKIAMSVINGHIPEAYAVNANYGTYQIEHGLGINTSFTLYDKHTVERLIRDKPDLYPPPNPKVDIPRDRRWNKQQINSQVLQAILQGESVKTLAKRIFPEIALKGQKGKDKKEQRSIAHKNAVAAMRTARTAMTGAQNAGRVAAYSRAEEMGIRMLQEWVSAHDGHTRESHLDVDGEQVPVGSEFSNECRFPGDPGGPPEETYNCRCTLVPALKALGQIKDENYKPSGREIDIAAYEEDKAAHKMSFEEWQKSKLKKEHKESVKHKSETSESGKTSKWNSVKTEKLFSDERKDNTRRFEDRTKADEYLRPILDKDWDKLSDAEKYSIWRYTENSNPINKPLSGYATSWDRGNFKGVGKVSWGLEDRWRKTPIEFKQFGRSDGTADYALAISSLTTGIDKYSMADDMWVVRGSSMGGLAGLFEGSLFSFNDAENILKTYDQKLIKTAFEGQTFVNHSFMSTGIAAGSGFGGEVSYEIFVPKGTHAIYAEPQSAWGATIGSPSDPYQFAPKYYEPGMKRNFDEVGYEAELIIQRGTQFRVSEIIVDDNKYHVKMEVVSQPDYFKTGYEQTFDNGATSYERKAA